VRLVVSSEQRFTCAQCGRCCHRPTVPITKVEAEAIRKAGAALWRDDGGNASADPFEAIPGHALFRIRKRASGACGFLTSEGRCAIHETLGERLKPIACRVFPFSFRPAGDEVIVSASFACPTVIANEGAAVALQRGELSALQAAWARQFPEPASPIEFVRGRGISRDAVARIRTYLTLLLDRSTDVRVNTRRIAALLEDWTRSKVLQLEPDAFLEYLEMTGNYALSAETPVSTRKAGPVARLLFRGFLFAVLALQVRLDHQPGARRGRTGTALTLSRLLAHVHGLGPAVGGFDLRRAIGLTLPLDDEPVRALAHRHLQAGLETLGATRRPIVDEIAMRVAYLNAACVIGAMDATRSGKQVVDAASFTEGLLVAGDLSHADGGGRLSALLTTLAGGIEALYLFPPLRT
jgi:Fe-S-cluster containining protein